MHIAIFSFQEIRHSFHRKIGKKYNSDLILYNKYVANVFPLVFPLYNIFVKHFRSKFRIQTKKKKSFSNKPEFGPSVIMK